MSAAPIYLDYNATTPIDPQVAEAIGECFRELCGNPASQHALGRQSRRRLEEAREAITRQLGGKVDSHRGDRLIFTSGATEANNLALRGLAGPPPAHLVISAIEHPSVRETAEQLEREGFRIDWLGCDSDGVVEVDRLGGLLNQDTRLVSVMLGNNETGALQPVAAIARICGEAGIAIHTDATQVVGKLSVDFHHLGVTAMSFSGHKFHGPPAIGGLLVAADAAIQPLVFGGFQQAGIRPGTESVALAWGMCVALRLSHQEGAERISRVTTLRNRFEQLLLADPKAAAQLNGAAAGRLPHTSNIAFPGLDRQALLMALDLAGIACSTGSACASGSSDPSPVLVAMGLSEEVISSSLRFSFGAPTTESEVVSAAERILFVVNELRQQESRPKRDWTARPEGSKRL